MFFADAHTCASKVIHALEGGMCAGGERGLRAHSWRGRLVCRNGDFSIRKFLGVRGSCGGANLYVYVCGIWIISM